MAEWYELLMQARVALDVSQAELAARAQVSLPSIKSYERGRRHPSRPYLIALLDALKIERGKRIEILTAAGFSHDGNVWSEVEGFTFTVEEAAEEVEQQRWPSFVLNQYSEVVVANTLIQRLWGVDLRQEFADPIDRNFLSVASDPRFAERVVNWDEAVGVLVAIWKGQPTGAESIESPSPYFAAVLDRFLKGDPRYVARFVSLWQSTPARVPKIRWRYPVVWRDPVAGLMRFDGVVAPGGEPAGLSFNDWIPVDAETWTALEEVRSR